MIPVHVSDGGMVSAIAHISAVTMREWLKDDIQYAASQTLLPISPDYSQLAVAGHSRTVWAQDADYEGTRPALPTNCKNCGAALNGDCEYCGTRYV